MNANMREFLFAFISVHSRLAVFWLKLIRLVLWKIPDYIAGDYRYRA